MTYIAQWQGSTYLPAGQTEHDTEAEAMAEADRIVKEHAAHGPMAVVVYEAPEVVDPPQAPTIAHRGDCRHEVAPGAIANARGRQIEREGIA